jgi:amino acid transporter
VVERYKQEFARVLSVFENTLIALSANSPVWSVFIIVPIALATVGTASFLSYLVAAFVAVAMALCWAELGATYPLAGGDYAIVTRVLGHPWGFTNFGLNLVTSIVVLPVAALGLAEYLKVAINVDARLVGTLAIVFAAVIASLKVRWGAAITGLFLTVELIALAVITYLGFSHLERPFSVLLHPVPFGANGMSAAATFGLIMAGVAVANFSYDGFRTAIFLSEEMKGSSTGAARAALWAVFAIVVAQILPLVAVLLGTKSVEELSKAPNLTAFVLERGGPLLNTLLSLAVAGAIFNALIANLVVLARAIYSSGRDHAWPAPCNSLLAHVHPRLHTPWIATLGLGFVAAAITPFSDIAALGTFLGAVITVAYVMIAVSALASRIVHRDRPRTYRMPLWPLPPILALAMMVYVMTQQETRYLCATLVVAIVSLAYYLLYVARQPGKRWLIKEPPN